MRWQEFKECGIGSVGKHLWALRRWQVAVALGGVGTTMRTDDPLTGASGSIIEQAQHDPSDSERPQEDGQRSSNGAGAPRHGFRPARTREYEPEGDDESDDKSDVIARHDVFRSLGRETASPLPHMRQRRAGLRRHGGSGLQPVLKEDLMEIKTRVEGLQVRLFRAKARRGRLDGFLARRLEFLEGCFLGVIQVQAPGQEIREPGFVPGHVRTRSANAIDLALEAAVAATTRAEIHKFLICLSWLDLVLIHSG
jgi:hypothetical protein